MKIYLNDYFVSALEDTGEYNVNWNTDVCSRYVANVSVGELFQYKSVNSVLNFLRDLKQNILFCICEWISESVMASRRGEIWFTCSNSRRSQFTSQCSICLRNMEMTAFVCFLSVTNHYCGVSLMTYFHLPLKKVTDLLRDFPQHTFFTLEPHNVFSPLTAPVALVITTMKV